MTIVAPGKFLDGIVMAVFMTLISGFVLLLIGEVHRQIVVNYASYLSVISILFDRALPMPNKKWTFNLQDILLFACLICLMSMQHNDSAEVDKAKKKSEKERAKKMMPKAD